MKLRTRRVLIALSLIVFLPTYGWSQAAKPAEKVRITVPAKSLAFLPFYLGQAKGIFNEESLQPELIVMRPPLGIVALEAGDVAYSAAPGVGMRAALRSLYDIPLDKELTEEQRGIFTVQRRTSQEND